MTSSGDNNRRCLFALLILVAAIVTALVGLEWPDRRIFMAWGVFIVVVGIFLWLGLLLVSMVIVLAVYWYFCIFRLLIGWVKRYVHGLPATHDGIQKKYRYIYKVAIVLLSYATIGLALYGFFVRALWFVQHGIAFMSANRTEDIALIALILLPAITGSVVLIAVSLDYLRNAVTRLKREKEYESTKTVTEANANLQKGEAVGCCKLSEIVKSACAEVTDENIIRKKIRFMGLYCKYIGCEWESLSLYLLSFVLVAVGAVFLVSWIVYQEQIGSTNWGRFCWFFGSVLGVGIPVGISMVMRTVLVPEHRGMWIYAICWFVVVVLMWWLREFITPISAGIPQQFGGFRGEHYIARWKEELKLDKETEKDYVERVGNGAIKVGVVYKTEKYLFLAPKKWFGENPDENWKALMLSTDGLVSLEPVQPVKDPSSTSGQASAASTPKAR